LTEKLRNSLDVYCSIYVHCSTRYKVMKTHVQTDGCVTRPFYSHACRMPNVLSKRTKNFFWK